MKANNNKSITLKNLLINEQKQIGIQFQPDKVVQALIKELPNIKWSKEFGMAYIPNNKLNIKLIFQKFRGVAWVNGNYFFSKKRVFNQNEPRSEEHTSELQSRPHLVCRLLLEKKKKKQ